MRTILVYIERGPKRNAIDFPWPRAGCPDQSDHLQPFRSMLLRFGRSLSRLRTQYRDEMSRSTKRVIKENLKGHSLKGLDFKSTAKWNKWADLQPIIDFLL